MKIQLTRRYRFSASHRLHAPELSAAENRRVYGKCNNPHGHGHNYTLDVTVAGPVDERTGMVADLGELDGYVERAVVDAFDHRYLNEEVEEFRATVPTAENLCREIYRRLKGFPAARLEGVRIEETAANSFEYRGETRETRS